MIPVLSVRLPWAWWLLNGPEKGKAWKDIENRTWPAKYRGPIFIHASSVCKRAEWDAACVYINASLDEIALHGIDMATPDFDVLRDIAGKVIGIVDLVDCVREHTSPWFNPGGYGFVMARPRLLDTPVAIKCPSPRIWTPTTRLIGKTSHGLLSAQQFHHLCDDDNEQGEARRK